MMKVKVYSDADGVALDAAKLIAKAAQGALAARGQFVMAVSGGKHPGSAHRFSEATPVEPDSELTRIKAR